MKRIGVFLLVGPLLGLVTVLVLTARISPLQPSIHLLAYFLWFAYLASLIPAMVSAAADLWLTNKSWRLLGAMGAGAAAAVVEMRLLHGHVTVMQLLAFCLFGAIPAAVCSWLSGRTE
jgi:hypothetical protein